jgi:hypothetical protein
MISFATGALITNTLIWIFYFVYEMARQTKLNVSGYLLSRAYDSMPALHFRELWLPGVMAGKCRNSSVLDLRK